MNRKTSLAVFWHRAVHALHFGAVSGLLYATLTGIFVFYILAPAWFQPVGATGNGVFSAGSFWNTPLPHYPMTHANSTGFAQDILQQVNTFGSSYDTTDQASPVYSVDPSTPTVSVDPWDCDGGGINPDLLTEWQAVPIPFYALPGDGANHAMVIYQAATQTMWELDHVQNVGGQWQACHGGKINGTNGHPGIFSNPFGTTDTGLPVMGGQISQNEFQQGYIAHAVGLSLPNSSLGRSWPAARSGGNGGSSIPQGTRLQLDPALDINSLGLSAAGRAVARAAQTYGFVVWDSAGTVSVRGEGPKSYTARGLPNPYGGSTAGALNGFPWDKLRALPANYGQSGPPPPNITAFNTPAATLATGHQATLSWQSIDVDECAIPGVASHLGASGSTMSASLHSGTSYTLACSGPGGSATRELSIGVTGVPENSPPPPPVIGLTITATLSGDASVLPELATAEAAATVQKVVYYENDNWLFSTATPPFMLDTTALSDGKHTISVQIYYRDGHRADRTVSLVVSNNIEPLRLPPPPTPNKQPNVLLRTAVNAVGMVGAFSAMGLASVYGWKRTHWL